MANRFRKLERVFKGVSNHRRIQILLLLESEPLMDVTAVSRKTSTSIRTASEHLRRLALSGLVAKKSDGRRVLVSVTPAGSKMISMVKALDSAAVS